MLAPSHRRCLDILASAYACNGHRGHASIDRALDSLPRRTGWYDPDEALPSLHR
ncbi:MAG TPA: hypothetical protein VF574_04210 [Allosphingosinicella sp.]|jgi:hypothetical protein